MKHNLSNKRFLQNLAKTQPPALSFSCKGRENWSLWHGELRAKIIELIGGFPPKAPLSAEVTDRWDEGTHLRERVLFQSEKGVSISAFILIPKKLKKPAPAVVCLHGHGGPGGKAYVCGVSVDQEETDMIARHNYDFAAQLVKRGYVTLAPDARGFGERRAGSEQGCYVSGIVSEYLGRALVGQRLFDDMRALDYLVTRPEVDPNRLGATGLSEGGKRTLFLAAFDDRVQAAVISGYFTTLREEILHWEGYNGWDVCNHIFGILRLADYPDIAALTAPRALMIQNGNKDPLYRPEGVLKGFAQVQAAYEFLGLPDKAALDYFDGEHVYNPKPAFEWFDRWL